MLFWIIVAWIVWSLFRSRPYRRYRCPPMGGWHYHVGGWHHPPTGGFDGGFGHGGF